MDRNISKYIALKRTAELGSFTAAAEELHYTQSGISRMINDLEAEWKVPLFERVKNGVKLTTAGRALLPYANALCADYENLQMEVDALNGLQRGTIRIAAVTSIASNWLPNVIARFRKDYPAIEYELLIGNYSQAESWLADGIVDCGFVRLPVEHEFDVIPLIEEEIVAVLPEDHPLAAEDVFPVEAFNTEPIVAFEQSDEFEISELFSSSKIKPHYLLTSTDDSVILSMVEAGLGISIYPELSLQRFPYRIVAKKLSDPRSRTIGFAVRNAESVSPAVEKLMSFMPECEGCKDKI